MELWTRALTDLLMSAKLQLMETCAFCGKRFKNKSGLVGHVRIIHPGLAHPGIRVSASPGGMIRTLGINEADELRAQGKKVGLCYITTKDGVLHYQDSDGVWRKKSLGEYSVSTRMS